MKKSFVFLIVFVLKLSILQAQSDIVSTGSNSWIFHTPDDGRTNLHIAPFTNGDWQWGLFHLENDGVLYSEGLESKNIKSLRSLELKTNGINSTELLLRKQNNSYYSIFSNNSSFGFYNSSTLQTPFYLSEVDNVGIGTINPQTKLDVNGIIQTYNKNASTAYWDNLRLWSDGENSYIESNGDEKGMVLKSNGANKISIMSNLGVGTTNPDEKLTVKGKIHAEEVRVDLNVPGPDYVFEQDYQLKSLPEIQSFIKENKHLPEVPSAKEMEEKGINLSEMNMLLLKKVEELTLHLIRIQSELDLLKGKLNISNKFK